MKRFCGVVALLAVLLTASGAWADTWYVDGSKSVTDPDGSADKPFATIQAALSNTNLKDGDTISVAAGTYTATSGQTDTNIFVLEKKNLTLIASGAKKDTILQGANGKRVLRVVANGTGATIKGFTIQGGIGTAQVTQGLGLQILDADATVENCDFKNNSAPGLGGGISVLLSAASSQSVEIKNCNFENNTASGYGGGGISNRTLGAGTLSVNVTGCKFTTNHAGATLGGGMLNDAWKQGSQVNVTVDDCEFNGNDAYYGAGICNTATQGATLTVDASNCKFTSNVNTNGPGGGMHNYSTNSGVCEVTTTNCTFDGNKAATGAGMGNETRQTSSSLTSKITNCVFTGNDNTTDTNQSNGYGGGGISVTNAANTSIFVEVDKCTFSKNTGWNGGGIFVNNSSTKVDDVKATVTNCTFAGNTAKYRAKSNISSLSNDGHGGGIYTSCSNVALTNCTFVKNTLSDTANGKGAEIFARGDNPTSVVTLTNSILWNDTNDDSNSKPYIFNDGGKAAVTLTNCAFLPKTLDTATGNVLDVSDKVSFDLVPSELTANTAAPSADGTIKNHTVYTLAATSKLIKAGTTAGLASDIQTAIKTDQLGRARTGVPDIGAWEYIAATPAPVTDTGGGTPVETKTKVEQAVEEMTERVS